MGPVNTDGSFHPHVIYDGRSDRPGEHEETPDAHRKPPNDRVCSICPTKS